jgi:hypothetical protein
MQIDVYHRLVSSDHDETCAALCMNYNPEDPETDGCPYVHRCWCPDGSLTFADFIRKHPDVTVVEAES